MGRGQISFEYLMLMGFITLIITGILGIALFYTGSLRDGARSNQISDFADKVVSTAEYVYYSGAPSKSTIEAYLPSDVIEIEIAENTLYVTYLSNGKNAKTGFESNVNITGNISSSEGIKKIEITALEDHVVISNV